MYSEHNSLHELRDLRPWLLVGDQFVYNGSTFVIKTNDKKKFKAINIDNEIVEFIDDHSYKVEPTGRLMWRRLCDNQRVDKMILSKDGHIFLAPKGTRYEYGDQYYAFCWVLTEFTEKMLWKPRKPRNCHCF